MRARCISCKEKFEYTKNNWIRNMDAERETGRVTLSPICNSCLENTNLDNPELGDEYEVTP